MASAADNPAGAVTGREAARPWRLSLPAGQVWLVTRLAAHGGGVLPGHARVKSTGKTSGGSDAYIPGGPALQP